jgi:hypothetical protein
MIDKDDNRGLILVFSSIISRDIYHTTMCTKMAVNGSFLSVSLVGIESLFSKTNCDSGNIDDMLGSKQGVTNQNMIQYLGIIEEKTNQLLLAQTFLANKVN